MNKKFPFIAIEGIDGVGKSTCAKLLAEKMSAYYYKTPSGIFEKVRTTIDISVDPYTRFIFYLGGTLYASEKIKKIVTYQPVVCDRYILSTIIYHEAMGVNISSIIQKQPTILAPDYYIYLYTDENTRTQRLISRNVISPSDIALENNKELQRRIHYEFIKSPGMIHIDTSLISPEEVCDRILKNIGG